MKLFCSVCLYKAVREGRCNYRRGIGYTLLGQHHLPPPLYNCNYQNRCDQTFWNSDKSKQSQEKVAHSIRGALVSKSSSSLHLIVAQSATFHM